MIQLTDEIVDQCRKSLQDIEFTFTIDDPLHIGISSPKLQECLDLESSTGSFTLSWCMYLKDKKISEIKYRIPSVCSLVLKIK